MKPITLQWAQEFHLHCAIFNSAYLFKISGANTPRIPVECRNPHVGLRPKFFRNFLSEFSHFWLSDPIAAPVTFGKGGRPSPLSSSAPGKKFRNRYSGRRTDVSAQNRAWAGAGVAGFLGPDGGSGQQHCRICSEKSGCVSNPGDNWCKFFSTEHTCQNWRSEAAPVGHRLRTGGCSNASVAAARADGCQSFQIRLSKTLFHN